MRRLVTAVLLAGCGVIPVLAGALVLQADNPQSNPEAIAKNAVVVAHTTACHSPEKTTITATAEGVVNGKRVSVPLRVIRLSEPGSYAVTREWHVQGVWAVKMIATNPDYKDYATSVVVPVDSARGKEIEAKSYTHAASPEEVASVLKQATLE